MNQLSFDDVEIWLPVVDYEGFYDVSNLGRVRSLVRITSKGRRGGRILIPGRGTHGYLAVGLCKHGVKTQFSVHRLVLGAFVGPCPAGMETRHLDGNPANNRLTNLEYSDHRTNMRDQLLHGTQYHASVTHCPRLHEYTPENTYIIPSSGGRVCRTCDADRSARRSAGSSRKLDKAA